MLAYVPILSMVNSKVICRVFVETSVLAYTSGYKCAVNQPINAAANDNFNISGHVPCAL
jgi:hypothetical protein